MLLRKACGKTASTDAQIYLHMSPGTMSNAPSAALLAALHFAIAAVYAAGASLIQDPCLHVPHDEQSQVDVD